ncbi:hypothetical protein AVEN_82989-1 [Araneus ventricosus]|uniref:Reverse transcriptase domain-containing protein n=1 Tax=Araneus ventricosus TaxID=182803 RepID=A0A4Y2GNJ4_ARAVE|nr:hypothetical protein AVEN_82989-1 [Araneus ventricosus]
MRLPSPYSCNPLRLCNSVGDTAALARGSTEKFVVITLQNFFNTLDEWLELWRIAVNADKTKAISFRKGHSRLTPYSLVLFEDSIEWITEAKKSYYDPDTTYPHYFTAISSGFLFRDRRVPRSKPDSTEDPPWPVARYIIRSGQTSSRWCEPPQHPLHPGLNNRVQGRITGGRDWCGVI